MIGDYFVNEECKIFQIIEVLSDGMLRCRRTSDLSNLVIEYTRFHIDEVRPEKEGDYWILKSDSLRFRIQRHLAEVA